MFHHQCISNLSRMLPRTSAYQNTSDQFGCKLSSISNLPYVNRTPCMWDNVWFNNAGSSVSYIAPTKQSILPSIQFPMSSFPHQMQSSEASDFTGKNGPSQLGYVHMKFQFTKR
ncbi:hypothetical protein SADUNF_Sadunf02G0202300 [Salix dunnii]|uniref:Uncharacterized protein n=1 Tax=Salix dunnii TaxID=1413687 RepID=A0A835N9C7_9ROSI|nr:hypothetical protein SADUNF_Sadunf02G0202300 [Salix dunnii]